VILWCFQNLEPVINSWVLMIFLFFFQNTQNQWFFNSDFLKYQNRQFFESDFSQNYSKPTLLWLWFCSKYPKLTINFLKNLRIAPTMVQSQELCIIYYYWHGKVGHAAAVFLCLQVQFFWSILTTYLTLNNLKVFFYIWKTQHINVKTHSLLAPAYMLRYSKSQRNLKFSSNGIIFSQ
jgi:hypothetical protein